MPSSNTPFSVAIAMPPIQPTSAAHCTSLVSATLFSQILASNYIELAQLLQPSLISIRQPRELQTSLGPMQLSHPIPSKNLTPTTFALIFSIFHDIICRPELDDYLSIILDMEVCFGGTSLYNYIYYITTQAAGHLHQFNQETYWGSLDSKLYCRVFAAQSLILCELCGGPSHPASSCSIITPFQPQTSSSRKPSVFNCLAATPPPPIIPKPAGPSINIPTSKGVDKRGRQILYQGGRMVSNNFNHLGCIFSNCRLLHTCFFCVGVHARNSFPHNPTTPAD